MRECKDREPTLTHGWCACGPPCQPADPGHLENPQTPLTRAAPPATFPTAIRPYRAVIGALGIWALFGHTGIKLGMGMTAFNQHTTAWGSAIFAEGIGTAVLMFAILGIVDSRSPGDLAGIVIGGVVVAIILVLGPITG